MIEHDLASLAERIAPDVAEDLTEQVLARIDEQRATSRPSPQRVRALVATGLAALLAASFLSPQVRAFAADLLDVLGVPGVEVSSETPDAPEEPLAPLPDPRETTLAEAQRKVGFRLGVPDRLGPPDQVLVVDGGRVVTMSWQEGRILLDQFAGHLGPVFEKQVGVLEVEQVRVGGAPGWWFGGPHDLTYVDADGRELTATARLAGRTLVWDAGAGVTFRLEGERLDVAGALRIARSVR
ncbi:hypothetical protein F0U44_09030 [Nocardioides humilatus]|uniref:DUF4367 domain-containing protein n=1 Tax=Nocardioides humilatus TaxID=2607660 RepID=A0A5B1LDB0_9ACTN|nr:hypothetical protein [Nocardioides humilatus]KAA1418632.1 hypothetical protein F0U44_09030 [Nocardioides humilatus]